MTVMTYRKKPVVIEAARWEPEDLVSAGFVAGWLMRHGAKFHVNDDKSLTIETLEDGRDGEAKHVASVGDYLIRGVKGEFYPCKPDIFDLTYEPA